MTDLSAILERLGLEQYLDGLVIEGFDTWETVLDIQETDLDALNWKRGHRRKLQREIATSRGISYERLVGSPAYESSSDIARGGEGSQTPTVGVERGTGGGTDQKRKYRRHPRTDENAPSRPPSAYVIFSNKVREDVKGDNLNFTEIAKLVGDRWQKLDAAGKEFFEAQASTLKDQYNVKLATYKKTEQYKEYQQYLAEFRVKHGPKQPEMKRPKLEPESSGGSISAKSSDLPDSAGLSTRHKRMDSVGSMGSSQFPNAVPSPGGLIISPVHNSAPGGPVTGVMRMNASEQVGSPSGGYFSRDHGSRAPVSSRSSLSEESVAIRSEYSDPLPRTLQPSLSNASSASMAPSFASPELGNVQEAVRRSPHFSHPSQHSQQQQDISASYTSMPQPRQMSGGGGTTSGSKVQTGGDESWALRPLESGVRGYPDLTRPLPPPLHPASALPFPLASLISPDRRAEMSSDQSQRILPLPRVSDVRGQHPSLRSVSHNVSIPQRSPVGEVQPSSIIPGENPLTPLESSENDAISALAGLASNNGEQDRKGQPERLRSPR